MRQGRPTLAAAAVIVAMGLAGCPREQSQPGTTTAAPAPPATAPDTGTPALAASAPASAAAPRTDAGGIRAAADAGTVRELPPRLRKWGEVARVAPQATRDLEAGIARIGQVIGALQPCGGDDGKQANRRQRRELQEGAAQVRRAAQAIWAATKDRGDPRTQKKARTLRLHLTALASSAEEVTGTMGGSVCKAMLAVDRREDHALRTASEWARRLHAAAARRRDASSAP